MPLQRILESEADAIDLINRALDALSSNAKLEAALDPEGTGIFDHYGVDGDADNVIDDDPNGDGNYRRLASSATSSRRKRRRSAARTIAQT